MSRDDFNDAMFVIVWLYRVSPGREDEFRTAYGPAGPWVRLFALQTGYLGTELVITADVGTYLSIDRWDSEESFRQFMQSHEEEYQALDRSMDDLTLVEQHVGSGSVV